MGGGLNYICVLTGYASAYADLCQNYIIIWQADDIKSNIEVLFYISSKDWYLGRTNQIAGFFDQSDSRSQVT